MLLYLAAGEMNETVDKMLTTSAFDSYYSYIKNTHTLIIFSPWGVALLPDAFS